jgi:CheY-like chemotaxis protein
MFRVMDRSAPSSAKVTPAARPPAHGAKPQPTVTTILDKLDAADDGRYRNRRSGTRDRFRRTRVPVSVRHPGGSQSTGLVSTRNLSNTGIGFLYQSFLHVGSQVSITLPRRLGGEDVLEGTVVYCKHVAGAHHQVGVRFTRKIFSQLYAEDETLVAQAIVATAAPFAGRLLMIDAQPMDRALVKHHLRDAGHVVAAETLAEALALMSTPANSKFDAVLCEIDLAAASDGIAVTIAGLRNAGHGGAIVVATPTVADAKARRALIEAGAIAVITKPYDRAELLKVLAQAVAGASVETAVLTAERGIEEVDAMVKSIEAVAPRKK